MEQKMRTNEVLPVSHIFVNPLQGEALYKAAISKTPEAKPFAVLGPHPTAFLPDC
jgi:hypothetical protein